MGSDGVDTDKFERATSPHVLLRRLLAECLGTFFLVLVDCGGAVVAGLSGGEVTPEARSLATGMVVMALAHTMGDVSGAHFNPAVTLAFALRRVFPWRRVPLYTAAQLTGAVFASSLLRALFGIVNHLGATEPGFGWQAAFVIEVLLTSLLICVVLGTATRHRVLGANAALASGATVAVCSLWSRPVSGASMNPARSIAPAIAGGGGHALWIYIFAPLVGALLGTMAMNAIHPRRHGDEPAAAGGERK